ncbi:MAG: phosphoribosylformylglycinamidine cyclo-ligase [Candidatus Methylopumilus sp.]|nr:phosphoribosylformylglycinamidine cyclo-ligase [Candidatus Methylopumilus sp.]
MNKDNTQKDTPSITYKDSGVNIEAGDALVEKIKPFAKKTMRPEVLAGIGGFGSLFEVPKKYKEPVLVSGTDGVGTKLKLAFELNKHDTVGIDLVAMSVNDILAQGAEPLFFLDYFACGKLDVDIASQVIKGIAEGCAQSGCALVGGETAEMPGMYPEGEYDLAGFAVGVVEKSEIINGKSIKVGDVVIGLASSGAHSNGYSLIRKIINIEKANFLDAFDGRTLKDVLMEPTRLYVKSILKLKESIRIKGIAHITGGGITENIPRILGDDLMAEIHSLNWPLPELFKWLQNKGNISNDELYRTFNCGIGMAIIIDQSEVAQARKILEEANEVVYELGLIRKRKANEHPTMVI